MRKKTRSVAFVTIMESKTDLRRNMLLCLAILFLELAAQFNHASDRCPDQHNCWYWIGLSKQNDDWVWDNHEPLTYTNWGPGEPDGCCGTDPICVFNNVWMTLNQWNDFSCGDPNTVTLCELEGMFYVVHCLFRRFKPMYLLLAAREVQ